MHGMPSAASPGDTGTLLLAALDIDDPDPWSHRHARPLLYSYALVVLYCTRPRTSTCTVRVPDPTPPAPNLHPRHAPAAEGIRTWLIPRYGSPRFGTNATTGLAELGIGRSAELSSELGASQTIIHQHPHLGSADPMIDDRWDAALK